ncbi:hypothetical protein SDRG_14021 [Saprolegnia diclina VS20]|uniref:GH18 domain-containing protein n=1 Tax=Saprolegnia diclina (strain VS20) TaxID=1156394 RepID=T0REX7_SAPDV|nr:hypothetical protein SDRG_14021 [Saprolegnia diclina VS20]EQC28197.1 hypothetical protein SDRG_14021 [Saprolegnia diclina VS20]|eukprot:XP_008618346.1 hypothetical protein SDRG_14021 [Saprolegnia diclina VS20]
MLGQCFLSLLTIVAVAVAVPYKNVVYFMEWGSVVQSAPIFSLDWSRITHINYAFGKLQPDGSIAFNDTNVAFNLRYPGDGNDPSSVYGQFGQANQLKKKFRGTKFGLSIGGWTWSDQFSGLFSTDAGRKTFVRNAMTLLTDLGLDFIDIDWEYPVEGGNDAPPVPHRPDDMANYIAVLKEFRKAFASLPFKAELSVASPAGPANYGHWDFAGICAQLDHINIMAYDLAGDWSEYTDHQANLYADPKHPNDGTSFSIDRAVQDYIRGGCPSTKIVLGIPVYGRSFENTKGLYATFTKPTNGSWVAPSGDGLGTWDYKVLPLPGATEYYDAVVGAAYSYDATTKMFVSYESPTSMAAKLQYIKKNNLGGTMFWAGDADAPATSARSLITQAYNFYGRNNMALYANNLEYPTSKYSNVRGNGTLAPTAVPSPTPSTVLPTPAPTTAPTTAPTSAPAFVCGTNHNVCFWPLTQQVLPYGKDDCVKFTAFVWCA